MLLAVDIGNTSTKFGIFAGAELLHRLSIPTALIGQKSLENLWSAAGEPIRQAITCSVVPEAAKKFLNVLRQNAIQAFQVTNDLDFGLAINYEPLSSIGTDRLVNAFAAVKKYGAPAIVCSFGTATTIDIIDKDRVFLGGMISPGLKAAAKSLSSSTSQLPEISIEKPEKLIGTSTGSAILSGIVFGHVAMFEGLIERSIKELGDKPVVIATGGFAKLIAEMTELIDKIDPDLTLDGLQLLSSRMPRT